MVTFWTCPCETCVRKRENEISSTDTAPVLKTFQARMIKTRMTIHKSRFLIVAFKRTPLTFPWTTSLTEVGLDLLLRSVLPGLASLTGTAFPALRRCREDWHSDLGIPSLFLQSVRRPPRRGGAPPRCPSCDRSPCR